jgi:hypothetical protein
MLSSRNLLMLTGLGALLATIVLFAGVMARPGADGALLMADAAPTSSPAPSPAAPASIAAPATPVGAKTTPFATDQRGFVNYAARCDGAQTAVAMGRTARSVVAICAGADGDYEYRGVRVGDGATLTTPAARTDQGWVARTGGATYSVTAADLVVTSGGKVIYRDTWIDYQQPAQPPTPQPTSRSRQ